MEVYKGVFSEKISESTKDSDGLADLSFASWYIRYTQKTLSDKFFADILQEQDEKKKKVLIDKLIKSASENSFETGFFAKNQEIAVGGLGGHAFVIDDMDIYYSFFENLKKIANEFAKQGLDFKKNKMYMVAKSISKTEQQYFGVGCNLRNVRLSLLAQTYDEKTDNFPAPSIKVLKDKGIAECVELASVAHNLWILTGEKSYYINSKDCYFGGVGKEYSHDAHAFNLILHNGSYFVFDKALGNFGKIGGNPIEDFLEDRPVVIEGKGVREKGVYGNYSKLTEKSDNTFK